MALAPRSFALMAIGALALTATAVAGTRARRSGDAVVRTARATSPPAPRPAPDWDNTSWLNTTAPIRRTDLAGRVVLLNFWVFTCVNCTRSLPSLVRFDSLYRDRGLTIVGIHTPEFPPYAGEHDRGNLARALARYGIRYANAQDNDRATWRRYGIRFWPSFVLLDKQGRIRYEGAGEIHIGDHWDRTWQTRIEALLAESP